MFIEEKMNVCAITQNGKTYKGIVYKIVIQPCKDDNDRPHTLLFISQDEDYLEQNDDFGCIALWVDKLKRIDIL